MPKELELTSQRAGDLIATVMRYVADAIDRKGTLPVEGSISADALAGLVEPPPETGAQLDDLLGDVFGDYPSTSLDATSPGFMGYVPGGGIFHAAVADLIADTLNRYVGVSAVGGAYVQIESNVVRWFCEFMGLPQGSGGYLTSGGSLANWGALIAAREKHLGEQLSEGVIYVSDQAHHCVAKAAKLAGIRAGNVRVLACDADFRLSPGRVLAEVEADRARGLTPFMLVASAGTTNTGAVDPLAPLAGAARDAGLWFHVDGAYGGFFNITERGRAALNGIDQADSIALDPHKTLFLPYGTGALLVRRQSDLHAAHASQADYLPPPSEAEAVVDFSDISPELTRPFRGLRVWLPLKMHGVGVFRRYLDEKLDLALQLCAALEANPQIEVLAEPMLSILAFACRGETEAHANSRSREVLSAINARGRVMLTGTMLGSRFAIRVAVVSYRTHEEQIGMLLEDLDAALGNVY